MPTTVMLIEDDPHIQKLVALFLKDTSYMLVAIADDGLSALKRIPVVQPDIIILDYCMPGMDGIVVLQRLREAGIKTPILMYSAFHDDARVMRCINGGANGFVLKYSGREALLEALNAMMDARTFWIDMTIKQSLLERCEALLSNAS